MPKSASPKRQANKVYFEHTAVAEQVASNTILLLTASKYQTKVSRPARVILTIARKLIPERKIFRSSRTRVCEDPDTSNHIFPFHPFSNLIFELSSQCQIHVCRWHFPPQPSPRNPFSSFREAPRKRREGKERTNTATNPRQTLALSAVLELRNGENASHCQRWGGKGAVTSPSPKHFSTKHCCHGNTSSQVWNGAPSER